MNRSSLKEKKTKKERPLDPRLLGRGWNRDIEQYEILKRCSKKKDAAEWNFWRKNNPAEEVQLFYANMKEFYLEGANLERVNLMGANLQDAKLKDANLQGAYLCEANMQEADLHMANLTGAVLSTANLQKARLEGACLRGADFDKAYLQGTIFKSAITDGGTSFCRCKVNRYRGKRIGTDFSNVDLRNVRIDAGTRQLLEYNIRRANWRQWYRRHRLSSLPVRAFWSMSDYGTSTARVFAAFFLVVLLFAAVYMNWSYWLPPGAVSNLFAEPEIGEAEWHYFVRAMVRPIYFSFITMTTLGFDDIYVNKESIAGHILIILEVISGYVLFGALVTRFAVLFTSGGPCGKFAENDKPKLSVG
ncbi:MAG: pentapeptide repeat-containing protein [Sedimentisphaerales bacterium]|nr:pentapeptide repeat-containing protein [Sedimentisphaerales bacterium]